MVPPPARERFDAARLINIANGLTAARVLLIPYFAYLLISDRGKAALAVFAVCGATDALDGLLAAGCGSGRWSGRSSTRSPTSC